MSRWSLLIALLVGSPLPAEEPIARVGRVYVRTVWADGRHNGFPGIAKFGEHYYVTFRNADSHKAGENTRIQVVRSRADDLTKWEAVAEFRNDYDARDPLLFVAGDRLRVVWHSKEDYTSDTADGLAWTPQQLLDTEFVEPTSDSGLAFTSQRRWLFRIRRGPDGAYYSLGRCGIPSDESRGRFGLILYRSTDGFTFKSLHTYGRGPTFPMSTAGGIGWGHEADVGWKADGTMVCAIRNGGPGVLSYAAPPYETWHALPNTNWPDFGGPALHTTLDGRGGMLVAARETPKERPSGTYPSKLIVRSVTNAGATNPVYIPSSGDCGYSSFAAGRKPEEVLLCYYSSHEWPQPGGTGEHPANIYLAFLTVRHTNE
jgi:hypothetical protein